MRVFCDFDGTIARLDTTDLVLRRMAAPEWEAIEAEWEAGAITAAECMRRQVALIGGDDAALDDLLDTVPLDPGFTAFARWCAQEGVPLSVVSDGVDRFIGVIMARHGLAHLPVVSNRLEGEPGARALAQPYAKAGCTAGSGVCKCAAVGLFDRLPGYVDPVVFVGDGRSDFCVAAKADRVFARDKLVRHLQARGLPFTPFTNFHEITAVLRGELRGQRRAALGAAAL